MTSMIDNDNIPEPLEPIRIEDFPGKDGPNLRSHLRLNLDPVLSSLFEKADHLSMNRGIQPPFKIFRFRLPVREKAFLPLQFLNKRLEILGPFLQLLDQFLIDHLLVLDRFEKGLFLFLDDLNLSLLLPHLRDISFPLSLILYQSLMISFLQGYLIMVGFNQTGIRVNNDP